jgi:hypothetical protein
VTIIPEDDKNHISVIMPIHIKNWEKKRKKRKKIEKKVKKLLTKK